MMVTLIDDDKISEVKAFLGVEFTIIDLSKADFFHGGIEIVHSD